jgi:DNA-binding response OmpR family regulator
MSKILLAEDDEELAKSLTCWLTARKNTVEWVSNGRDALDYLLQVTFDAAIIDWQLPGMMGPDVCTEYRSRGGTTPVIILTGRGEIADKTKGLDSGADDYLTKPFNHEELAARLRAITRRPAAVSPPVFCADHLRLDTATGRVYSLGEFVDLNGKEYMLLEFFMRHPNQLFSPEKLIEKVWPTDTEILGSSIKTYVKRIRAKIDLPDRPSLIKSVYGMGYIFEASDREETAV